MNNASYIIKRIASVLLWILLGWLLIANIVHLSEGEFTIRFFVLFIWFILLLWLRIPFSQHLKQLTIQRKAEITKTREEQAIADSTEFRMHCNVCGHVYCYTAGDLRKNKELAAGATTSAIVGLTQMLCTSTILGKMYQNESEQKLSKIIDYSRCPNCKSSDVAEIPEGKPIPAATPTTPAPAASAMDELKKLKELLDLGIVTQEEFDAKKKQLLGL